MLFAKLLWAIRSIFFSIDAIPIFVMISLDYRRRAFGPFAPLFCGQKQFLANNDLADSLGPEESR